MPFDMDENKGGGGSPEGMPERLMKAMNALIVVMDDFGLERPGVGLHSLQIDVLIDSREEGFRPVAIVASEWKKEEQPKEES